MIVVSDEGLILQVYVQPGARKNEIVGLHNGALKVKIQAPPEDGKANEALVKFIAKILEIPTQNVSLISGQKNRNKKLLITGTNKATLQNKLNI
jgi:hypothetical protein